MIIQHSDATGKYKIVQLTNPVSATTINMASVIYGAANLSSPGLFASKTGTTLLFKGLSAGDNIVLSATTNSVVISAEVPAVTGFTSTSEFNSYTGTTETRLDAIEADVTNLASISGWTASNGLTRTQNQVALGGTLTATTTIEQSNRALNFGTSSGSGTVKLQSGEARIYAQSNGGFPFVALEADTNNYIWFDNQNGGSFEINKGTTTTNGIKAIATFTRNEAGAVSTTVGAGASIRLEASSAYNYGELSYILTSLSPAQGKFRFNVRNGATDLNLVEFAQGTGTYFLSGATFGSSTRTNASTLVELSSTNKALLLSRLNTTNVATAANGMLVYSSNAASFKGYEAGSWRDFIYKSTSGTRLFGRYASTTGYTQEITIGSGLRLNSSTGVLSYTGASITDITATQGLTKVGNDIRLGGNISGSCVISVVPDGEYLTLQGAHSGLDLGNDINLATDNGMSIYAGGNLGISSAAGDNRAFTVSDFGSMSLTTYNSVGGNPTLVLNSTGIHATGAVFDFEDSTGVIASLGASDISLDAGNDSSTFYAYGNTAGLVSQDSSGTQVFAFILDEANIKLTGVPAGTTSKVLYYDTVNGYITHGNAPSGGAGLTNGDKGDITVAGSGSSLTIDAQAVTYAKIQNVTGSRLLGRYSATAGSAQEISVGSGLALNSGTGILSFTGGSSYLTTASFNSYSGTTATSIAAKADKFITTENVTGTTYTFVSGDNGKLKNFTHVSGCTATIPSGLTSGWYTNISRASTAGVVTLSAGGSVTLNAQGTALNYANTSASIFRTGQSGTIVSYSAFGSLTPLPVINKTFVIESPTSSEKIAGFWTTQAITMASITEVAAGTTPSVTYQIKYDSDFSAAGTNAVSRTVTSTTSNTVTNTTAIPAGRWVWITTSAASGTISQVAITLSYNLT
jgi:hypothetical protein